MLDRLYKLLDELPMVQRNRNEFTATVGDGKGGLFVYNPDGTKKPGYVLARVDQIGVIEVRCRKVTEQHGWPVRVAKAVDGVWEIIEEDAEEAIHYAGDRGGNVGPHRWTHQLNGSDPDMVEGLRFRPLLTEPTKTPSLSVKLLPYHYTYGGTRKYWPGGEVDLTSEVPTTGSEQKLIVVYLNPSTNTASYVAGSAVVPYVPGSKGIPFTGDDIANLSTSGYLCSVALRLYTGQAEILWSDFIADVRDFASVDASYPVSSDPVTDITDAVAGENLSIRDRVYLSLSDGKWYKTDSDATATVKMSPMRGFATEAITASSTGTVRFQGVLGGFTSLTAGAEVYASTTAGGITQTKPAVTDGGGQIAIDRAGQAVSTTEILVQPSHVEFAARETLANNATLTIEHFADAATMTRNIIATILTAEAGSSLESYADTNQDVGVPLRGPSGAGATESSGSQTGTPTYIGNYSGTDYWEAQSFQCTAGRLSQITVTLDANSGSPTGDITWEIQGNSGGLPDNSVLQSGTFTPVPSSQNTITVTNGIFLAASTTYWLVLHAPAQATGVAYKWQAASSGTYANGQRAYAPSPGTSWTANSYDQMFTVTTSPVSVGDKLAQGFQVTGAQTVGSVQLYMKKTGSPTGTMTLRIETDSGGDPSGTLVDANATTTVAESSLTTSYGDIAFAFATSFSISGSTQYHIVLSTDRSTDTSNYVLWGADASSPSYANGEMKSEASSVWSAESKDAIFDVLGEETEYQEPLSIRRWSGGDGDCAVRYDDGSAGDASTKTTFKNTTGSPVDMTGIVRL